MIYARISKAIIINKTMKFNNNSPNLIVSYLILENLSMDDLNRVSQTMVEEVEVVAGKALLLGNHQETLEEEVMTV